MNHKALLILVIVFCLGWGPLSAGEAPAQGRNDLRGSVLVVAGRNHEDLNVYPSLIESGLREELESAGWRVETCEWPRLTPQLASLFNVLIFIQTPNVQAANIDEDPLATRIRTVMADFMQRGGGILVFPDLFRGRIYPMVNAMTEPYGLTVLRMDVQERAQVVPFENYPSMGWAVTRNIVPSPITEGVEQWAYPIGNEVTWSFIADDDWQVLVRGEATAYTRQGDVQTGGDSGYDSEPPLIAVRPVGEGRLGVWGSHSSFWVLSPTHAYWDHGILFREGQGLRLMEQMIDWLAEPSIGSGAVGGFEPERDGIYFQRDHRVVNRRRQGAALEGPVRQGVIGLRSSASGGANTVAEYAQRARELGLDYIVFTEEADVMSDPANWNRLVEECRAASDAEFLAFPGIRVDNLETGNEAIVFNLKKPWPEYPWDGPHFDTFIRIGVNNDWSGVMAMVNPQNAPVPYYNQGAITAYAVRNYDPQTGTWSESFDELAQANAYGWALMPITYRPVSDLDGLTQAAADGVTQIFSRVWGTDFRMGADGITQTMVAERGELTRFSSRGDNAWEPELTGTYSVDVAMDGLKPGDSLEVFYRGQRLRRVPAADGTARARFTFSSAEGGDIWVRLLDASDAVIGQSFVERYVRLRSTCFIGTDRMNGYWYPVRHVAPDDADAYPLEGDFGQLLTTVYPQLGWGEHWIWRTENQWSSPLGFEVYTGSGGIPRMYTSFSVSDSTTGGWEIYSPQRRMVLNSTDATVFVDDAFMLREEKDIAGRNHIQLSPQTRYERETRTTGYRWDRHAALLVEQTIEPLGQGVAPVAQRVFWARLGDAWSDFHAVDVRRGNGEHKQLALTPDMSFDLATGEGFSLGERAEGTVSLWALRPLVARIQRDGNSPVVSLSLPDGLLAETGTDPIETAYLVVVSSTRVGEPFDLDELADFLAVDAVSSARVNVSRGRASSGFFLTELTAAEGSIRGTVAPADAVPLRFRLSGLNPAWDAGWVWVDAGESNFHRLAQYEGTAWGMVTGEGAFFAGHPFVVRDPELIVQVSEEADGDGKWTVTVHNPTARTISDRVSVNPDWGANLTPQSEAFTLAGGESVTVTFTH